MERDLSTPRKGILFWTEHSNPRQDDHRRRQPKFGSLFGDWMKLSSSDNVDFRQISHALQTDRRSRPL